MSLFTTKCHLNHSVRRPGACDETCMVVYVHLVSAGVARHSKKTLHFLICKITKTELFLDA